MLKGNLIVGKNQSVVVHAESLPALIKLAESKSRYCRPGTNSEGTGISGLGYENPLPLSLRVDFEQCGLTRIDISGGNEALAHQIYRQMPARIPTENT